MEREQLKKLPYALPQCVTVEMVNEKFLWVSPKTQL